jgi:hypothetical protein
VRGTGVAVDGSQERRHKCIDDYAVWAHVASSNSITHRFTSTQSLVRNVTRARRCRSPHCRSWWRTCIISDMSRSIVDRYITDMTRSAHCTQGARNGDAFFTEQLRDGVHCQPGALFAAQHTATTHTPQSHATLLGSPPFDIYEKTILHQLLRQSTIVKIITMLLCWT